MSEGGPERSRRELPPESEGETAESLKAEIVALRSELEKSQREVERLREENGVDDLTKLKLRGRFTQELGNQLKALGHGNERKDHPKSLAVVFVDLDDFKHVNDTYGHAVGDEVLKDVADVLQSGTRATDLTARWGGEEFVVALIGATEAEAAQKAEELRTLIQGREFLTADGKKFSMTASMGVASTESGAEFNDIVKNADEALYAAKGDGKNRVYSFGALPRDAQGELDLAH